MTTPQRLASLLQSLHLSHQILVKSSVKIKGARVSFRQSGTRHLHRDFNFIILVEQCGHRYAIRAGRNLPDKEFRQFRTVIVTAAVYRGFDQELRLAEETNPIN